MIRPNWMLVPLGIILMTVSSSKGTTDSNALTQDKAGLLNELIEHYKLLQNIRVSVLRNTDGLKRTIRDLNRQHKILNSLLAECRAGNHEATTTTPATTTTTAAQKVCPIDGIKLSGSDTCLIVSENRLSFNDAQNYCRWRGGRLANKYMDTTMAKLASMYGEFGSRARWPFWVGAMETVNGVWRWIEGPSDVVNIMPLKADDTDRYVTVTFGPQVEASYWLDGEPKTKKGNAGLCMLLDGFNEYKATTYQCEQHRRFVCQI